MSVSIEGLPQHKTEDRLRLPNSLVRKVPDVFLSLDSRTYNLRNLLDAAHKVDYVCRSSRNVIET